MELRIVRAYLDTNVFHFGLHKKCNSSLILESLELGSFIPIISSHTIFEIRKWYEKKYGRQKSLDACFYIQSLSGIEIVTFEQIKSIIKRYRDKINEKDLPHLCAALISNPDYFITTNRHFLKKEFNTQIKFITPKKFVADVLGFRKLYDIDE